MDTEDQPPAVGRQRKRVPLNMRTTRALRDRVEAAAEASGRSIAQEVEFLLERSFWEDDRRRDHNG